MFGGSGVTRSLTGAARVLGLMCLLCLISLDNCMESNFGPDEVTVTAAELKEAHRMIQYAEDVKESKKLIGQTSVEMYAEWDRHADALQDIIARGAPQMRKLKPIFQLMDNVNIEVRENLLLMIDENEQMAMKLDKAKELVAYLEKRQKPKKDEL